MEVIDEWRSLDPPGRFLKQDDETNYWNDVGDEKACKKTSQALRDSVRETAPESNQSDDEEVSTSDEEDEDDSRSPEDRAGRLTNITEPGPHDCLFGRGRGTSEHPGNIRFRKIVNSRKQKYESSNDQINY